MCGCKPTKDIPFTNPAPDVAAAGVVVVVVLNLTMFFVFPEGGNFVTIESLFHI